MVIDSLPIPSHKCRDKQQKGTLRLMEISHQHVNEPETEAGDNYYPGSEPEGIQAAGLQEPDDSLQGFPGSVPVILLIRSPLLNVMGLAIPQNAGSGIIKGLQGTHRCSPDSDYFIVSLENGLKEIKADGKGFPVHRVSGNG